MLPWPSRRWGASEEQASEEQGPAAGSDASKAWNSGAETLGEPGTPPQDSPQPWSPRPSSTQREELLALLPSGLVAEQTPGTSGRYRSPRPSWTQREELLAPLPSDLVPEQTRGTPVPLSPQMASEVTPSRITQLAPWDPNHGAKAGPQQVWGPSCGSGASFSGRTLCHPSFCPLYEAASGRGCRPLAPTTGHQNGEQAPRVAGFPVMNCEDVFLSDPLLPRGQRIPLYLSESPQQAMGPVKLLLPPPIMSPRVRPTHSRGLSIAWLSGPELIALTGLLQMSQGEPRPSSSGSSEAPVGPACPPDPVSDHPGPSGCPSCSHCTDPSPPRTPDTH